MVVLGAGGHANEVLDVLSMYFTPEELFLFDNTGAKTSISPHRFSSLLDSVSALEKVLQNDKSFCVAVGMPMLRQKLTGMALALGGKPVNALASTAYISPVAKVGAGVNIMHLAYISPGAEVADGALINCGALVHHDVTIGQYAEISPGAVLLGGGQVASLARIGARAVIMPGVLIGEAAIVGAGAVVLRNVLPGEVVVGVPAKSRAK